MENTQSNNIKHARSDGEKEMLKEFRMMLDDVLTPDYTDVILLKWLRAKNFDLKKCEEIFRGNLRSREVFKIDDLDEIWDVPEVIEKYEFANHLGIAKDGTPVHYVAFGRGDLRGFILSLDLLDIGKYCSIVIERDRRRCKEQSKLLDKEINEVTYVVDMEEFTLGQLFAAGVLELGLDLMRMLQDQYPEIWKYVLIINAPAYFYVAFNLIKPILRRTFLQNVRIASRENSPALLLNYIDEDVLPVCLGGKRMDSQGDPMCSEFMNFGGEVPEKYYLRNRPLLQPTDFGVGSAWIPGRGCYNVPVIVRKANSIIRTELRTEGGSLPCCILYRKFGPDPENTDLPAKDEYLDPRDEKCNVVLVPPYIHLETHLAPLDNYLFGPWPGIYIMFFDNTYNWLTSRRVIYRYRVLPPEYFP